MGPNTHPWPRFSCGSRSTAHGCMGETAVRPCSAHAPQLTVAWLKPVHARAALARGQRDAGMERPRPEPAIISSVEL